MIVSANPVAESGDSGWATAQSSATNTGNTGWSTSVSRSNPVAISGDSGATGHTGPATSNPTVINLAILGISVVFDSF